MGGEGGGGGGGGGGQGSVANFFLYLKKERHTSAGRKFSFKTEYSPRQVMAGNCQSAVISPDLTRFWAFCCPGSIGGRR